MNVTQRVKTYLRTADLRKARLKVVAPALHMSTSTLDRKLRREGTVFSELVAQERIWRLNEAIAENRNVLGIDLVKRLGYSHHSPFYKGFRTLMGVGYLEHKQARTVQT